MLPQLSSDHMTDSRAQVSDLEIKQGWTRLARGISLAAEQNSVQVC